MTLHRGKQSVSPLSVGMDLEHGLGGVDHPTGVVVTLRPRQGGQPGVVLVLHLVGGRPRQPVVGIRFEILGIPHPAEIIKLVAGRSRNRAAVGSPTGKAGKLGEDVELIAVFLPLLEVLGDHPPAIVEDLGVIFVGAEELGNILLKKFLVVVFFQPAVELGAVAVEMRVAVELVHVGGQGSLGFLLDPFQLFVGIAGRLEGRFRSFHVEAASEHCAGEFFVELDLYANLRRGDRLDESHLVKLISFHSWGFLFESDILPSAIVPREYLPGLGTDLLAFVAETGRGLSLVEPVDSCVLECLGFWVFKLNPLGRSSLRMKTKTR